MDPHANIAEQRQIAKRLIAMQDRLDVKREPVSEDYIADADRLAELVIALDWWRINGGFDPYAVA